MIELLRVDDRLIHGQVAVSWTAYLGADTIVVANDAAAHNDLMKAAFKMAKPPQVVLSLKSVEGAILVLNNPKYKDRHMFVVCASPVDAARIAEGADGVRKVCLGGIRQSGNRRRISPQVFLDDADMDALSKLEALGAEVTLQSVPDQKPMRLEDIRRIFRS
jgi:fructoselysine and glucoselysine-specific PTS system IIB component